MSRTINRTLGVKTLALLLPVFFIAAGIVFVPYVGIQTDEALFSAPLYAAQPEELRLRAFHHDVPLMLMSYLGASKTWLYAAIFSLWTPGVWSLRIPPLLAGAATVWLFYRFLRRAAGEWTALAGATLLATDVTFLLTTVFDWGPVALQHLLLMGGLLLVLSAYQDQNRTKLGWGFFLFGLAMWDKALFAWALSGVVVGCAVVFPRELRRMLTARNIIVAVFAALAGALPLVIYNIRQPLATFERNTEFSTEDFAKKVHLMKLSMDGSALFGYMVHEETGPAQAPVLLVERASVALRDAVGPWRSGLLFWAFVASLALAPLWRPNRRAILFALVVLAVAWPQMVLTKDAGATSHHTVLLWPFPHIVVAAAFCAAVGRLRRHAAASLAALVVLLCGANLLLLNQHLAQLVRYGAAGVWNDAIFALSRELGARPYRNVLLSDWGELDSLRLLHDGQLHVWVGSDPLMGPAITPDDLRQIKRMLELPSSVFVCHTKPYEVFPGVRERLMEGARLLGYGKHMVKTIADSNGRPVYELVEFSRQATNAAGGALIRSQPKS